MAVRALCADIAVAAESRDGQTLSVAKRRLAVESFGTALTPCQAVLLNASVFVSTRFLGTTLTVVALFALQQSVNKSLGWFNSYSRGMGAHVVDAVHQIASEGVIAILPCFSLSGADGREDGRGRSTSIAARTLQVILTFFAECFQGLADVVKASRSYEQSDVPNKQC